MSAQLIWNVRTQCAYYLSRCSYLMSKTSCTKIINLISTWRNNTTEVAAGFHSHFLLHNSPFILQLFLIQSFINLIHNFLLKNHEWNPKDFSPLWILVITHVWSSGFYGTGRHNLDVFNARVVRITDMNSLTTSWHQWHGVFVERRSADKVARTLLHL